MPLARRVPAAALLSALAALRLVAQVPPSSAASTAAPPVDSRFVGLPDPAVSADSPAPGAAPAAGSLSVEFTAPPDPAPDIHDAVDAGEPPGPAWTRMPSLAIAEPDSALQAGRRADLTIHLEDPSLAVTRLRLTINGIPQPVKALEHPAAESAIAMAFTPPSAGRTSIMVEGLDAANRPLALALRWFDVASPYVARVIVRGRREWTDLVPESSNLRRRPVVFVRPRDPDQLTEEERAFGFNTRPVRALFLIDETGLTDALPEILGVLKLATAPTTPGASPGGSTDGLAGPGSATLPAAADSPAAPAPAPVVTRAAPATALVGTRAGGGPPLPPAPSVSTSPATVLPTAGPASAGGQTPAGHDAPVITKAPASGATSVEGANAADPLNSQTPGAAHIADAGTGGAADGQARARVPVGAAGGGAPADPSKHLEEIRSAFEAAEGRFLRPQDEIGIVMVSRTPRVLQDFPDGSMTRLLDTLNAGSAGERTGLGDLLIGALSAATDDRSSICVILTNGVYWGSYFRRKEIPELQETEALLTPDDATRIRALSAAREFPVVTLAVTTGAYPLSIGANGRFDFSRLEARLFGAGPGLAGNDSSSGISGAAAAADRSAEAGAAVDGRAPPAPGPSPAAPAPSPSASASGTAPPVSPPSPTPATTAPSPSPAVSAPGATPAVPVQGPATSVPAPGATPAVSAPGPPPASAAGTPPPLFAGATREAQQRFDTYIHQMFDLLGSIGEATDAGRRIRLTTSAPHDLSAALGDALAGVVGKFQRRDFRIVEAESDRHCAPGGEAQYLDALTYKGREKLLLSISLDESGSTQSEENAIAIADAAKSILGRRRPGEDCLIVSTFSAGFSPVLFNCLEDPAEVSEEVMQRIRTGGATDIFGAAISATRNMLQVERALRAKPGFLPPGEELRRVLVLITDGYQTTDFTSAMEATSFLNRYKVMLFEAIIPGMPVGTFVGGWSAGVTGSTLPQPGTGEYDAEQMRDHLASFLKSVYWGTRDSYRLDYTSSAKEAGHRDVCIRIAGRDDLTVAVEGGDSFQSDDSAAAYLLQAAADTAAPRYKRRRALEALGSMGSDLEVPGVLKLTTGPDDAMRIPAFLALIEMAARFYIPDKRIAHSYDALPVADRIDLVRALGAVGDSDRAIEELSYARARQQIAEQVLAHALIARTPSPARKGDPSEAKSRAAEPPPAPGSADDEDAVPPPEPAEAALPGLAAVRREALMALGRLTIPMSGSTMKAIRGMKDDPDAGVRQAAVWLERMLTEQHRTEARS